MRDLTKDKALELIGESVADFSKDIVLFVPSFNFEQPFIMYQSIRLGCTKKHLSNDIKANFDSGIYKYTPKSKPFDITKHELSEGLSISNMCKLSVEVEFKDNDDCNYVPLHKDDVIAIAKALGVTGEDLK